MKKVFISGVFDCLHDGHRDLLEGATQYGDVLVAVNCDSYVRKAKGKGRPHDKDIQRMINVIDTGFVRWACVNYADSPLDLILDFKPDWIAVGSDYTVDRIVGLKEAAAWGGKAVIIPRTRQISTTQILKAKKK